MSKDSKPHLYYLIRRGWYGQLLQSCEGIIAKKGKEPTTVFWQAFALGMLGSVPDALSKLGSLSSRKDLQLPMVAAMIYFHTKASSVDREAVRALKQDLPVAETVTKEAGLTLAARFHLFVGNYSEARAITRRLLNDNRGSYNNTTTVFEMEALLIESWCTVEETVIEAAGQPISATQKRTLCDIDTLYTSNGRSVDLQDLDSLMCWTKARWVKGARQEALTVLNQAIATNSAFLPALADKTILLASNNDWDQALDTAQRLLDQDPGHLDGLQTIAVHAFTQEYQPHDATAKLEELDSSLQSREGTNAMLHLEMASLFHALSCRQPRTLQLCARMLDRAVKVSNNSSVSSSKETLAALLCELGSVCLHQGRQQADRANRCFLEALKAYPSSIAASLGLAQCELTSDKLALATAQERLRNLEDADGQLELMATMHSPEDLGADFAYLEACIARSHPDRRSTHLPALLRCYDMFLAKGGAVAGRAGGEGVYLRAFEGLRKCAPDFAMELAMDFFRFVPSALNSTAFLPAAQGTASAGAQFGLTDDDEASVAQAASSGADDGASSLTSSSPEAMQALERGRAMLDSVISAAPGFLPSYLELSRLYLSVGAFALAIQPLQTALSFAPQSPAVLLGLAFVEAAQRNTAAAQRLVEQLLAVDFSIRSAPRFKLLRGIVHAQNSDFSAALTELEAVLVLPEIGFVVNKGSGDKDNSKESKDDGLSLQALAQANSAGYADPMRLSDDDRVLACVVYAGALSREHRAKDADRALKQAGVIFAGSPQEVQVLVANAQLVVDQGDYDKALRLLNQVSPSAPAFAAAVGLKAAILLTHLHDREKYTQCYQDLLAAEHSVRNLVLLGDSYLRILNSEAAVTVYEEAYRMDPANPMLRTKIGRALISTHEYHRAIEFYESALRVASKSDDSSMQSLAHDLIKLYMKLGRHEAAQRVATTVLFTAPKGLADQLANVKTLQLLVAVQRLSSPSEVMTTLQEIHRILKDVYHTSRTNPSLGLGALGADGRDGIKNQLAAVCNDMAVELLANSGPGASAATDEAEQLLGEAQEYNNSSPAVMLTLARVHRNKRAYEAAQLQCQKIVSLNGALVKEALRLQADVLLLVGDAAQAVAPLLAHLQATTSSMQYELLAHALPLLRRAGKLADAKALLTSLEADKRHLNAVGYHFCNGLYARYTNDIAKSVRAFNLCRRDPVWAPQALTHMIELYLNPDSQSIWDESGSKEGVDDATRSHIAIAEALLAELAPIAQDPLRFRVLEAYAGLGSRNKVAVDRSSNAFADLLENDPEYLPAVLGMATCFMIGKDQHKARNLLKRVGKLEPCDHDGEDFEKAHLLLAKFFVDKNNASQAQEVCKRLLQQNKSCSQAWELLGLIFEKEANYDMAADAYQKAWALEFEASATVGFKLAFSLLKCRRLVEAVDVCAAVLKQYPDYPRITEEILVKALHGMRCKDAIQ